MLHPNEASGSRSTFVMGKIDPRFYRQIYDTEHAVSRNSQREVRPSVQLLPGGLYARVVLLRIQLATSNGEVLTGVCPPPFPLLRNFTSAGDLP